MESIYFDMQLPILQGKKINLRRPVPSDAEDILKYAGDAAVARFLPLMPHPYTLDDAHQWINSARRSRQKDTAYDFGIEHRQHKKIIGGISLKNINREDRNAEVGYCLAKEFWRQGIVSEALDLILRFSFRTLRLHRVYAVVHDKNVGSFKLLEKAGFVREGIWREGSRFTGRYCDVYAYGMLRSEYKAG